ncbi:hypothetical protein C1X69_17300 [Pseudomonas sp. FW305-67]|nr:hypothetical protein C1X70_22660 [Pseudomonas sp. FW305-53]PMY85290.1 hypothetical protein C1X68_20175 [Pseudomonas sp. FW303-C2]PMY93322.1 hypothetical protein C1X67_09385 [Pseudomonas sp. FW305-62]PNA46438.1 hypothetical protein C1X71_03050 [Pseudomonas sp. FW306-2-2C-A10BC]PNA84068.1 hypothetical protein C1X66_22565 [Pseudomonas sp. MPR-R3B]PNB19306.1 hypothetical protein C1X69_17300 [Pseudomonas sp. FW305-67]
MNPANAVCLMYRDLRFYDCYAAERSLRQLLQEVAVRPRHRRTLGDRHAFLCEVRRSGWKYREH